MTLSIYLQLDIFSILLLFIIYCNSKSVGVNTAENRMFQNVIMLVMFTLVVDWMTWEFDGKLGNTARILNIASNAVYFAMSAIVSCAWILYTKVRLSGVKLKGIKLMFLSIPMFIVIGLAATSQLTGAFYHVSEENVYTRGTLFWLQAVVGFGYMGFAALYAFGKSIQEEQREKKVAARYMAAFVVMPFLASILQTMYYGLAILWPSISLSLLLVYINLQSQQITTDPLTKLNNRGHMNKYLMSHCAIKDDPVPLYLVIIDVDEFKGINDTYGHLAGDQALIKTAEILKKSFNDSSAFLARYGGDEFAVIYHGDEAKFMEAIDNLRINQAEANMQESQFKIEFSIGYAKFGEDNTATVEQLVLQADKSMYINKRRRKTE